MYSRKITEDLECGIVIAAKVFAGKWKPCIIDSIHKGNKRPSEIHRSIKGASARVINMQLKELVDYHVVYKKIYPELPPRVEYHLTKMGTGILPIIEMMNQWGDEHKHQIKKFDSVLKTIDAMKQTSKKLMQ